MSTIELPDGLEYMASPYSDPDPSIRFARAEQAAYNAALLIAEGRRIYSPVAYYLALTRHGVDLPGDYGFWRPFAEAAVRAASRVLVLMLDGWDKSEGVRDEINLAKELGKPRSYLTPADPLPERD